MQPEHRLIELPERVDSRGSLIFGQQGDHIPFPVKRFFALQGVAKSASRGGHAHREQHQFLIMLVGSATITVDNGQNCTTVTLDRPSRALYAPPMLWLALDQFSKGAVCLVLTSDLFSEADYLRDHDEFTRLTAGS